MTGLEGIGGFGGKADILNRYNTYLGNPGMFEADFARYRGATVASVKAVVNEYLNTRNRLLVRFRPEQSGAPSKTAVDRTKEPPLGADRPFTAPEVKTSKLANGLEVFVVERPELPKVSVALATRAGGVSDPAGKGGLGEPDRAGDAPRDQGEERARNRQHARRPGHVADFSRRTRERAARTRGAEAESLAGARGPRRGGAAAVISGRGIRSREEAGARRAVAGRQQSAGGRQPRRLHAGVRSRSSLWTAARRPALDRREHHPRRCEPVPSGAVEARQLGAGVRRRHHAGRSDRARQAAFQRLVGRGGAGGAGGATAAGRTREGLPDRSTERRADGRSRTCCRPPRDPRRITRR